MQIATDARKYSTDRKSSAGVASFVVFRLATQRCALPLGAVNRFVRAVAVTFLPNAPDIVLGVIDVAGRVIPVFNLRLRFGFPEHEIVPADQFLIAYTTRRMVALVVDEAQAVKERVVTDVVASPEIVPGLEHIQGVVKLDDGLVVIHDLEKLLSLDEERALDFAMSREAPHGT